MRKFDELQLNELEHGIAFLKGYVIIRANRNLTFMIFTFSVIDYHLDLKDMPVHLQQDTTSHLQSEFTCSYPDHNTKHCLHSWARYA